jgi:hypothetical protein
MSDDVNIRHDAQVLATGNTLTLNEGTTAEAASSAIIPSFVGALPSAAPRFGI